MYGTVHVTERADTALEKTPDQLTRYVMGDTPHPHQTHTHTSTYSQTHTHPYTLILTLLHILTHTHCIIGVGIFTKLFKLNFFNSELTRTTHIIHSICSSIQQLTDYLSYPYYIRK